MRYLVLVLGITVDAVEYRSSIWPTRGWAKVG